MSIFSSFAIALVAVVMVGFGIFTVLEMPDVFFSYSSGECVKVVNYGENQWSCGDLPKRFNHIWVD